MGTGIQSFCYPENAYYVLTPYQPIARFIDSNAMFLVSWRDLQTEASAAQSGHTHPAVLSGNCPGGAPCGERAVRRQPESAGGVELARGEAAFTSGCRGVARLPALRLYNLL